jgi:hypothetical protein
MRSLENTIYFASVNYALRFPDSATSIIDPSGRCQAYLPYGQEGVLVEEIDPAKATGLLAQRYAPGRYPESGWRRVARTLSGPRVETVPFRGYRFIAAVDEIESLDAAAPETRDRPFRRFEDAVVHSPRWKGRRTRPREQRAPSTGLVVSGGTALTS